jgi:hypothetical protein
MISAIGSNFGINSITSSMKAGVPAMDASLNEGKTQGLDRAMQRDTALQASDVTVQTKIGGDQPTGPAREAARAQALGQGTAQSLAAQFLVMASAHAPGPKSMSALLAEDSYRAARSITVAPVNGTAL